MWVRGLKTKPEAVRVAVEEGRAHAARRVGTVQFSDWLGLGKRAPENPRPRVTTDDDLWR